MANVVGSAVGIFLLLFPFILWCCLWGFTTKAVVINRGYESEGRKYFWYGFWFGMFAVIVAFSKPQISDTVQPFAPRRVTPRWEPDGVVLDILLSKNSKSIFFPATCASGKIPFVAQVYGPSGHARRATAEKYL